AKGVSLAVHGLGAGSVLRSCVDAADQPVRVRPQGLTRHPHRAPVSARDMNELKETLRGVEQRYKLFQQQQFTFISALEHCREDAHDKTRPVSSIGQVQDYMDHHCHNSTSRRVLRMFLDICAELSGLCQHFEALHTGTPATNTLLEKCKTLVSQSNDLSNLRAKYPHDVVNHLSCDEAKNHYGGVVSLIPLVLDLMKEWVAHSEKLPRKVLQHVSEPQECQEAPGAAACPRQGTGARPRPRKPKCGQLSRDGRSPRGKDKASSKPPWRPSGGKL
ncbi:Sperm acrosome-associated protein 9, partial [Galemys pyrenaicus]